jgi:hypothetical protein
MLKVVAVKLQENTLTQRVVAMETLVLLLAEKVLMLKDGEPQLPIMHLMLRV